jgi:hypothetical protein
MDRSPSLSLYQHCKKGHWCRFLEADTNHSPHFLSSVSIALLSSKPELTRSDGRPMTLEAIEKLKEVKGVIVKDAPTEEL